MVSYMKNKSNKLYNLIFPVWLLRVFPLMWLIIIPGNFIIDSLVLIISMYILKIDSKKQFYKKHIFKVYLFGMLSDLIGVAYMFLLMFVFQTVNRGDELILTIPGVLVSASLIFIFNYFISFRKIDKKERIKLSLIYAIITAPYTFMIPLDWIYM